MIKQREEAQELRKQLEDANFKMSTMQLRMLKQKHKKLLSQSDISFLSSGENVIISFNSKIILQGFTRLVIGAHGPYIEFEDKHLQTELEITKGQEWRELPKYKSCKYSWLNPAGIPNLKIYKQKNPVRYADYRPGFYYVDYWTVEIFRWYRSDKRR